MKHNEDILKERYARFFRYILIKPKDYRQQHKIIKIPVKFYGLSTGKFVKVNVVK